MSKFLTRGCINGVKLEKVLLFGVRPFVVLTGDRINEVFFYKKMYGHFSGQTSSLNNEVTLLPRWP